MKYALEKLQARHRWRKDIFISCLEIPPSGPSDSVLSRKAIVVVPVNSHTHLDKECLTVDYLVLDLEPK